MRLFYSGVVIVFEDNNVTSGQRLHAFVGPFAASNSRGAVSQLGNTVGIFLAFGNKNRGVRKF